ncbi:MAG: Hsp70 family protein [Chloroflexi bacterium]|nr:Hsp70 family protein [Chloroflexota bacterium]
MTAHTIGIELQDGSFAPIVPTGTYVPMPKPAIGLFRTSIDNQQRLEVNVYEGDDEIANKNELIGTVDIPLVSQYKKDTPISVAIRVDKNRITEVSAQISPPHGEKIDAKLKRNQLTPELKEKILASRQKLINFLDEWKDEITLAEQVALRSAISEAAKILSGESVDALSRENLDEHINISTEMLKHCTRVRGEQASLSHAIPRLEGLVPPNDLQPLRNIYNSLEEAREQANFDEALRLANESTEMLRKFGRFMDIVHAEALAASGRLSPTLSARVQNAAGAIRRSVQNNNANQVKSGMTTLDVLWDEIHVEIAQRKDRPSEIVLPNKGR